MATQYGTRRFIAQAMNKRDPFRKGNISAEWTIYPNHGQLPKEWATKLDESIQETQPSKTYIVFSYQTPIAWLENNQTWTIPDVSYSTTTKHHQHVIMVATQPNSPYLD